MPGEPKKLYYSISEAAKLTGVKPHVLRYWETEFSTLRPKKTRSGSRRYRQRDLDEILAIKKLLYEEGFRIAGARKIRRQSAGAKKQAVVRGASQIALSFSAMDPSERWACVREELQEILELVRQLGDAPESEPPVLPPPKRGVGRGKAAEAEG